MKNFYTNALTLYGQIDEVVEMHYNTHKKKPPCAKGCASCCSQFFEISELEFLLISEAIDALPSEKRNALASRAQTLFSLFKDNWPSFYSDFFTPNTINLLTDDYYEHPQRFKVVIPCVFLSNEGLCEIYERRPLTCRTTGVGFQQLINFGAVCNYIKIGITTPLWQADLRPLRPSIDEIRWLTDPDHPELFKRQYPMFYYVYDMFYND
jgi:Fe-S-cluster containining protein